MGLTRLNITNFRNLLAVNIEPHAGFNIFYGENGSGKTSLLESIYFLGLGRSFRHHLINRIINHNTEKMSVFGLFNTQNDVPIAMGIEKNRDGKTLIRMDNETLQTNLELTKILPIQLINPENYYLLEDGPKSRRQFLDWGVFHVEQSFFPLWKRVQRILKQRNAALRSSNNIAQIQSWDIEFVDASISLEALRQDYMEKLKPIFQQIQVHLLGFSDISLEYQCGWNVQHDLKDVLRASLQRDLQLGYTQFGPQRTDIRVYSGKFLAQDVLSRGQQKLLVCALRLAQGLLLRQLAQKQCIYLIDDLAAELDSCHRRKIAETLISLNSQIYITTVNAKDLSDLTDLIDARMYHITHGLAQNMV